MDEVLVIPEGSCLEDVVPTVSDQGYWKDRLIRFDSPTKDGLVYTRGSKDGWNRWAEIIGHDAYSWDRMIPFLLKVSFCDSQNLMNVSLTYKGITRVKSWFRIRKIKLKRGISIHLSTVMEGRCPILHPTITTQSTRCSYRQHKIYQMSSHTYLIWTMEARLGSVSFSWFIQGFF